ncbi:monocarboxylate transporter 12-B-like protein [Lates japonicus]|uniref:Monocarboxylate transporter 12-B-like protein n=1 Tax=Lates japonicus TaxID=270547 RepID=A0AAD3NEE5_LATJO|nr:monocarboxylate transporter 12-B-like protein [Lates japonicus]
MMKIIVRAARLQVHLIFFVEFQAHFEPTTGHSLDPQPGGLHHYALWSGFRLLHLAIAMVGCYFGREGYAFARCMSGSLNRPCVGSKDPELAGNSSKEPDDSLLSSHVSQGHPHLSLHLYPLPCPPHARKPCLRSFCSGQRLQPPLLPTWCPYLSARRRATSTPGAFPHVHILGCLKPYRLACYVFSVGMEGLCCLFTPLLRSFPLLVPFAILYGYFDGAYVALIPVVTSDVVGAPYLSSALGVVYFLHAIPYLVSPPIGGWLVDVTGSYTATFFLSGAALLASALILSTVAGIRHCCRRHCHPTTVAMETKHEPLPLSPSDQSDCFMAFNKEAVGQAVAS